MSNQAPVRIGEHEQKLALSSEQGAAYTLTIEGEKIVKAESGGAQTEPGGFTGIPMDDGMFEQPAADEHDLPDETVPIIPTGPRRKAKVIAEKAKQHVKKGRK